MMDRKEVDIISYLELEEEKRAAEKEMANNPAIADLKKKSNKIKEEINIREFGYRANIHNCVSAMQSIKEKMAKEWDTEDKSVRYATGSATIRTTRSIKVDNKELLIGILQHFGKLAQCIKTWDLTYLRKLVDAGLFEGADVTHYEEKKNVAISGVKNGGER